MIGSAIWLVVGAAWALGTLWLFREGFDVLGIAMLIAQCVLLVYVIYTMVKPI